MKSMDLDWPLWTAYKAIKRRYPDLFITAWSFNGYHIDNIVVFGDKFSPYDIPDHIKTHETPSQIIKKIINHIEGKLNV